jgi:hypothetical protein
VFVRIIMREEGSAMRIRAPNKKKSPAKRGA